MIMDEEPYEPASVIEREPQPRTAARLLEVTGCSGCPFDYDDSCTHPDARDLRIDCSVWPHQALPPPCPLRVRDVLVRGVL